MLNRPRAGSTVVRVLAVLLQSYTALSAAAVAVQVAEVVEREVAPAFWGAGSVVSRFDSQIAAETSGRVVWSAELGSGVAAGEPLLQLDDSDYQLQQRLDQAEISRISAQLGYLDKQRSRLEALRQRDSSSQMELDRLLADSAGLGEQLRAAQVALEQTQLALARSTVTAPFAGVVAERSAQLGEYVNAGQAVVRLVSVGQLEGSVRAPISTLRNTAAGSQVMVTAGEREALVPVAQIVAVADPVSRLVEVRLALAGSDGWVVGEPLRVALAQGKPLAALTVPRDALVLREGEAYLMRVEADNRVAKLVVRLGFGERDYVVVEPRAGVTLRAGDRVVVRGAERLRSGQEVNVLARPVANP